MTEKISAMIKPRPMRIPIIGILFLILPFLLFLNGGWTFSETIRLRPATGEAFPRHRLISGRSGQEALFQPNRCPGSGALRELRTPRPAGRPGMRRNPLSHAGVPAETADILPAIIPLNSTGLNPCLNPVLHRFHTRACPVRAGPSFRS